MKYSEIDHFMKINGLDKEPAFEYLHFLTEPIPKEGSRTILGLYFPEGERQPHRFGYLPPSTIILPEDADYETLKHELGHRYGDYYYQDISEPFAEKYRKSFKEASMLRANRSEMPETCLSCPELNRPKERLCAYCRIAENGEWNLVPARSAAMRGPAALLSDYVVTGFTVSDWAKNPLPGDPLFVDVKGEVFDQYAGFPDSWQLVVAVAVVNSSGVPNTSMRTFKYFNSVNNGKKFAYDNIIVITDSAFTLPWHSHLAFGDMPSQPVSVWVELFANHSNNIPWDWTQWSTVSPTRIIS